MAQLSLDSAEMEASTSPSSVPDYSLPVSKLLTYGDCLELGIVDEWPNYLELGFTQADIPELVRLASDRALFDQDESEEAVIASWAPLHAWRTLGQLQAEEAIEHDPTIEAGSFKMVEKWRVNGGCPLEYAGVPGSVS